LSQRTTNDDDDKIFCIYGETLFDPLYFFAKRANMREANKLEKYVHVGVLIAMILAYTRDEKCDDKTEEDSNVMRGQKQTFFAKKIKCAL
jgi:hypothetical protein